MSKETKPITEINIPHPHGDHLGKAVKFVPRSEAIKMVESGQASWPTRTLSFEEQLRTPMAGVVVPHPSIPNQKAVKFVPQWQAESMVKMGEFESRL